MTLEAELNESNKYYLDNDIAVIYKKPTPVKVVKQINEKIVNAYFEKPSTTDYNGLYDGKYVDFEAKETTRTAFPLANIHAHQIKHMERVLRHGGICFLIVRFTKINETYLLFGREFINFINTSPRKSVPIDYFREKGHLIKDKLMPKIDYIEIIDKYGGML
ncbi:MAG: Holliday junction resolvase RecU [Bacilli bacterium]|nr:Holliday junction resolvase RecU [Bacilli bacterium]